MNKFIFNFFYKKRYTMFEHVLLGAVVIIALTGHFFIAGVVLVLGMFASTVFQVLAQGAKKYGI